MPAAQTRSDIRTYKGVGVSPGIAIGRAVIVEKRVAQVYRIPIRDEEVGAEVRRFNESLEKTRDELLDLKQKVSRSMGEEYAQIFEAHAMIVGDASFADKVVQKIEEEQVNAEWALAEVQEELQARFASFEDDYLRERVADVKDVAERVLVNLQGIAHHDLSEIDHDVIIIADDLTPSDTVHFNRRPIVGFVTEVGGRTSHTSIIAKSLFMPAVIGVPKLTKIVDSDELVIVDGYEGTVVVNPTPAMVQEYISRVSRHEEAELKLLENRNLPATTKDHHRISLQANIELVEELDDAIKFGAEGIGLYRSEFLYIATSPDLPTEEEHYNIYRKLAESTAPNWCIIRTFDLGGKKLARQIMGSKEDNPVLGLRALRLCMQHRDMFKTQLRALLRASAHGKIKIMFPLVSGVQELRQVKTLVREIRMELDAENIPYNPELQIGIMIEVPSAAFTASLLAREVDFFTIGTNVLIQYTLAVDRTDERVSDRYEPLHPAVLRLLRSVRRAAERRGIPVSVCGEMASDPLLLRLLIGCGLTVFSMTPGALPVARRVIQETRLTEMRQVAARVLTLGTVEEIEQYLRDAFTPVAK
ncbi:MAG TPA: phosphoenolpyruvate--protein phosphotransferase [Thermoanaerobaculia bacterium]|nr:phosphoenolpyruvate--protein phosphotransferase [Thermoanaerobaculia bacterium]